MTAAKTQTRTRWVPSYARGGVTYPKLPPSSILPSKVAKARAEVVRFSDVFKEQNTAANELHGTVDRAKLEYRQMIENALRAGEDTSKIEDPVPAILEQAHTARAKADAVRPIIADALADFGSALVSAKDAEVVKATEAESVARAALVDAVRAAEDAARDVEFADNAVRFWNGVDGAHPSWKDATGLTTKTLAKVRRDVEAG